VADALFSEPRLAELYDPLDADRRDLDAYLAMAAEFGAATVVDIGCGTGTLACLMAQRGLTVLTGAGKGLVSFRSTVVFASDGAVLTSDSTLRFRERAEIAGSLASAGLVVDEVRDAPDRPGLEFVFIARRPA
jgi:SAM-dependent methyltransferase